MPSVAGFQYYVKHSLAFDRLAENRGLWDCQSLLIRSSSNWRIFCKGPIYWQTWVAVLVVALDVEPADSAWQLWYCRSRTTYCYAVFTLDESRTVTSQFWFQEISYRKICWTEEHHSGTFSPTVLDIHYKIRTDSTDYPALLHNYGQCHGSLWTYL